MEKKQGFFEKLKQGLSRTGGGMFASLFAGDERIDAAFYDELEEALSELEDQEPDEDDEDEYEKWEDEYSDIESLMEEIEEKIEELSNRDNES